MTVETIALMAERARRSLVDRIATEPWAVFPGRIKPRPGDRVAGRHLYLMRAGDSGALKIGRANDPARRARDLQVGCPERIQVLAILPEMGSDEHYAHQRFAHLRLAGEWFSPSPEIVEWFGVQR